MQVFHICTQIMCNAIRNAVTFIHCNELIILLLLFDFFFRFLFFLFARIVLNSFGFCFAVVVVAVLNIIFEESPVISTQSWTISENTSTYIHLTAWWKLIKVLPCEMWCLFSAKKEKKKNIKTSDEKYLCTFFFFGGRKKNVRKSKSVETERGEKKTNVLFSDVILLWW